MGRPSYIPDAMSISVNAKLGGLPAEEREAICREFRLDGSARGAVTLEDGSVLKCRKISYRVLPGLAERLHFPVKELFREHGMELKWPSRESEMFHDLLCQLEEDGIRRVLQMAVELTPSFWWAGSEEYIKMGKSPTRRMFNISRRAPGWATDGSKAIRAAGNKRLENLAAHYKSAMPQDVVRFAEYMGVSSLWLFGWADGKTKILSPSPLAEQLACAYPFFGREVRLILENAARLLLEQGEDAA